MLMRADWTKHDEAIGNALTELRVKLEAFAATVEGEVAALDAKWRAGDKDLNALETVYRKYSSVARWRQQLEEREIALLVASGLSNRDIAGRLFISKRTVDAHVEHIFAKLEISSRVKLTMWLQSQARIGA